MSMLVTVTVLLNGVPDQITIDLPIMTAEEEAQYIGHCVDEDTYYDDLWEEMRWYNYARQMGWE